MCNTTKYPIARRLGASSRAPPALGNSRSPTLVETRAHTRRVTANESDCMTRGLDGLIYPVAAAITSHLKRRSTAYAVMWADNSSLQTRLSQLSQQRYLGPNISMAVTEIQSCSWVKPIVLVLRARSEVFGFSGVTCKSTGSFIHTAVSCLLPWARPLTWVTGR